MRRAASAKKINFRDAFVFLAVVCAMLLTSCQTTSTQTQTQAEPVYKFTVMLYPEPIEVAGWQIDPAQDANPEGAALNIVSFMQHGDVDRWLASWAAAERPTLTREQRDELTRKWQPLKDGRIAMRGRVVAGGDIVVELAVQNAQKVEHKVKLPLLHEDGQWRLTSRDDGSEYVQWETSTNKIVASADPLGFKSYLNRLKYASSH
jgi:hypothetical protein